MDYQKPQRFSLVSQLIEQLESGIEDGTFAIGEKLPGEQDLAERFGVGRSTMREAMQALVAAGVLESKQGAGSFVVSRSRFDASLRRRLSGARIAETLEVRELVETQIATRACRRRTVGDLAALGELLKRRNDETQSLDAYIEADKAFHFAIAESCRNALLRDLYEALLSFIGALFYAELSEDDSDRGTATHIALFDAITRRDEPAARKAVLDLIDHERSFFGKG